MGCGKSKHDVVADTISQSKKSKPAEQETSNAKSVKIVHEKAVNGHISDVNGSLGLVDNAKPDTNGETIDATKVYMKEEILEEAKDSKADNLDQPKRDDSSNVAEEQRHEVLIPGDSPKEEGNIEGVISEGISGKTAYYSPASDDVIAKENAPFEEMAPETKTEEIEVKEQLPVTEEIEAVTQVIIPDIEEVVPASTTEEAEVIMKEVPVEEDAVPTITTEEVVVTEKTPASEEGVPTTQGEMVPVF